jgi:hypothetical protein
VRHLVIEAGVVAVTLIGVRRTKGDESCQSFPGGFVCTTKTAPNWTLFYVGLGGMVVNSIWSIVTAVGDATAHINAAAPATRQPGRVVGGLYVDPRIRVLGSQTGGTGTRTSLGFQVGRVAFAALRRPPRPLVRLSR